MNHSLEESPLIQTKQTKDKMERWVEAQVKGEKIDIDVYGKPSEKQLRELENVRSLSRELQENLHELENSVRIADVENQAMNPTAPVLDCSEDHEFVTANQLDDYYSLEDQVESKEAERKRLMKGKSDKTEIQKFFKDQCVFLTGGTGFLGKVMIEKLIRSCGEFDTIYVLIRAKKGKDASARLHDLFNEFLFQRAHEENPKGAHRVIPIVGDMSAPGLGISEEDRKTLTSRVTIIINAAATVKFDEKLSIATGINVRGTKEVLKLAKECRNLIAITHVSTAFANTHVDFIEEKFYEPPMTVDALEAVSQLDENLIDDILPKLLGKRPNTYCFTKAIAEEAVKNYGEGLPICIFRPSIVISTYDEPYRSWTDSVYGPTGLIIGIGVGALRTMYMGVDKVADVIPVDLCANAILSSTWYTAKNYKENQTSNIPIYNFVSGAQNPLTWGEFIDYGFKYGQTYPTMKAIWYVGINPTNNYYVFLFYNFFLHYLPALLVDSYFALTGKRQAIMKLYTKLSKLSNILFYFSTQEWKFSDNNVQKMWSSLTKEDQVVFPFNMAEMSWDYMMETLLMGIRVYLVKDDLSTLPEARKRWNRLYYMHCALKLATILLLTYFGYLLFKGLAWIVLG